MIREQSKCKSFIDRLVLEIIKANPIVYSVEKVKKKGKKVRKKDKNKSSLKRKKNFTQEKITAQRKADTKSIAHSSKMRFQNMAIISFILDKSKL